MNGISYLAIDNRPASADKIIGFGSVGIRLVLPAPAWPYTSSLRLLADTVFVLLRFIAILSSSDLKKRKYHQSGDHQAFDNQIAVE
jgi:hypothetical protein